MNSQDKTLSRSVIRVFIQARMSATRFPGKVLAPLNGQPVIAHVISQVAQVIPSDQITVATSEEHSDDPLVCYIRQLGISVYRGPHNNVFQRFQLCLEKYPCDWFFRISADSPLLCSPILTTMMTYGTHSDIELVTNIQVRTFPKGHSVEMLRSSTFARIDADQLSAEEKEHLTKVYYNHPADFRIVNIESSDPSLAGTNLCVDTIEDLHRLEEIIRGGTGPQSIDLDKVHGRT